MVTSTTSISVDDRMVYIDKPHNMDIVRILELSPDLGYVIWEGSTADFRSFVVG